MSTKQTFGITTPLGFWAAGGACGIKAKGKFDLTLIVADVPCAAAGVFTTNKMKSQPVLVDLEHLRQSKGQARAIVCNSGNANASMGRQGLIDAKNMCAQVARQIGCPAREVLVCSTGVIGRRLPMDKITPGIDQLAARLDRGNQADAAAARGIMTTDLVPKTAHGALKIDGKTIHLAGICKGSGMIAPNLGTMLVFLTTDAAITSAALQQALRLAVADSFNRISVDQHTSPSDTVLVLASGLAGNPVMQSPKSKTDFHLFAQALIALCKDLAYQIVQDGEGATKVYRVVVRGAKTIADADRVGRAIVDSPLVKCAVHGGDPNWGRIATAAGYSSAQVVEQKMSLFIGPGAGLCVFRHGQPTSAGLTPPARLKKLMAAKEITCTIDLGVGKASCEWLGCDLSRQYIAINADYTT